ncbi:SDR family oxidoreductase [Paenibacillus physcomitrellae]|uniref:NAD(P)-dependent oxidoreductase n=1 Tax=Paenibacillus physcomitrellae TaxID=1619311 RepID=A0ABQ1FUQ4_9BACL|nr:SDR family oxidoreductase [Paenibacillus physcomitrellae]GGA31333.1 NAD(P)-dependent oxidoreductase [Paenibacillus physcomitrellae]
MNPKYPYFGTETVCKEQIISFPPQHQDRQPGIESKMVPLPIWDNPDYKGSGKLEGKVALVTGGDSGIGRATSVAFAKEGADVAIAYLYERSDALVTKQAIERLGRRCLLLETDLRVKSNCEEVVRRTLATFGKLDVLVNNHGVQFPQDSIADITDEQLYRTYQTNILSYFHLVQAALPALKPGSSIINTTSVTAYRGAKVLVDYSSTKGAVVSFTRSLALQLVDKGIRVNAVAPGPIWTPLIVSSYDANTVKTFGLDSAMKRAGQPYELAPAYVFLASELCSSFVTGEVLHVNGGQMVTT